MHVVDIVLYLCLWVRACVLLSVWCVVVCNEYVATRDFDVPLGLQLDNASV